MCTTSQIKACMFPGHGSANEAAWQAVESKLDSGRKGYVNLVDFKSFIVENCFKAIKA